MIECGLRPDTVAKVVAIVRTVGQVERLRDQLNVCPIVDLDALCEAGIQLKERVSAQRIVGYDCAACGNVVQSVEAVLRTNVIAREREVVLWIRGWYNYSNSRSTASVESVARVGEIVRTRRAELHDRRELQTPWKFPNSADRNVMTFVVW